MLLAFMWHGPKRTKASTALRNNCFQGCVAYLNSSRSKNETKQVCFAGTTLFFFIVKVTFIIYFQGRYVLSHSKKFHKEDNPFLLQDLKDLKPYLSVSPKFSKKIVLLSYFPILTEKKDKSFHHQSEGEKKKSYFSSGENSICQLPRCHAHTFPFLSLFRFALLYWCP